MNIKSLLTSTSVILAIGLATPAAAQLLTLDTEGGLNINLGIGGGSDDAPGIGVEVGVGVGAGVNLGANGGDDEAPPEGTLVVATEGGADLAAAFGENEANARVDAVIGLIANTQWTVDTLATLEAAAVAAAFDVAAWVDAQSEAAWEAALTTYAEAIATLQSAAAASAQLSAWLEANTIAADSVVAVGLTANGELAVFTY